MTDVNISTEDYSSLRKSVNQIRAMRHSASSSRNSYKHESTTADDPPYSPSSPAYHVP